MASRKLALLLVLCIMFMHDASDIAYSGHGFFHVHAAPPRKMMKTGMYEQLRTVPSGPDPLHHNGNAPKKPRTIP